MLQSFNHRHVTTFLFNIVHPLAQSALESNISTSHFYQLFYRFNGLGRYRLQANIYVARGTMSIPLGESVNIYMCFFFYL